MNSGILQHGCFWKHSSLSLFGTIFSLVGVIVLVALDIITNASQDPPHFPRRITEDSIEKISLPPVGFHGVMFTYSFQPWGGVNPGHSDVGPELYKETKENQRMHHRTLLVNQPL
ncbi:MAG: hypothetical protein AB7P17_00215 [Nitrospirales bacterium]|nr:hypothetical protein [Nitrospirales bacterium]